MGIRALKWVLLALGACGCGKSVPGFEPDAGTDGGPSTEICGQPFCDHSGAVCGALTDACGAIVDCGACRFAAVELGPGSSPSLAVHEDKALVAYWREAQGDAGVFFFREGSGSEQVAPVAERAEGGRGPQLAVDAAGTPWIAYSAGSPPEVRVATLAAEGNWRVEVLGQGTEPSLAVDQSGIPHLVYFSYPPATLRQARREGEGWQLEDVVQLPLAQAVFPDLAFAKDGALHLAFADQPAATLNHGRRAHPEPFVLGQLASDVEVGGRSHPGALSLAVAPDGTAQVAYGQGFSLMHAAGTGSGWATWPLNSASADRANALAVGPLGQLFVAYFNLYGLHLGERAGERWGGQTLSGLCSNGQVDLALDSNHDPVVAFSCGSAVRVLRRMARYPDDYFPACAAMVEELCLAACDCSPGTGCCVSGGHLSTCSNASGCPGNLSAHLCGDATLAPTLLFACRDQFPQMTCGPDEALDYAIVLPPACDLIFR